MALDSQTQLRLNACLTRERERAGLRTDLELATHLKINPKTISFWRNGKLSRVDAVLARVLAECASAPDGVDRRGA